ncbi:MAG: YceH family protein [Solirubrobacteraceae bacterium]
MQIAELTVPEQRVLGCLIEKRWTTPDTYPLSLNALRLACNQSTNRDPVTDYDESTVRDAAQRLCRYGLARLASYHASRSIKYRHLAEEALGLDREQLAVLSVLLLRGPQTPGELKARSERIAKVGSLADVERVLAVLSERGYARRLERRPGQKEVRFEQLLGGQSASPSEPAPQIHRPPASDVPAPTPVIDRQRPQTSGDLDLTQRVAALEADVASLRAALADDVASLRAALAERRGD